MQRRTCPTCGSHWSEPRAVWCGHCGASLTPETGSLSEPAREEDAATHVRRRSSSSLLWVVVASVALIGVATVVFAVDAVDGGPQETDIPQGADPSGGVDPERAAEPRGPEPPPTLGCDPDDCMIWWTDRIDHRWAVVHDGYLVHLGRDALQGLDVRSGATLWQQPHPAGWDPPATTVEPLVDEHGLVLATRDRVWMRDLATGELRAEVTLDGLSLQQLERVGSHVLAVAWDAPTPPTGQVLLLIDEDGEVVWRRSMEQQVGVVGEEGEPMDGVVLIVDDGRLVALRMADGSPQWWRDIEDAQVLLHGDRMVRAEPGSATVEVYVNLVADYPARPRVEHRITFDDEVSGVGQAGAFVLVAAGDRAHLVDPNDGSEVAVRRFGDDDPWGAEAVQSGDRTVVLWPSRTGEGHHDLEVYERGVGLVRAVEVGRDPDLDHPHGDLHALGDGVVRVLLGGRQVADIDIDAGEPTGRGFTVGEDIVDLTVHGDLVRLREQGVTTIFGRDGTVSVVGASGIASVDPLIVHGGAGAMRVDRDLLVRD